ncbi:MAG TPA: NADH-quinone oxidoreductase subunit NuoF [Vicinamibacterales bacterium]|jgi:NADH-quinone oxidoreductase subunit F|nr:NADH-quinone oxidoreductase subunit NuoF [Vicinamibacterales bacterium]
MAYEPVLIPHVREPQAFTLDSYVQKSRGYTALKQALGMPPGDIIEQVKASGLRGRGGAGFPTGMKWQFVLKDTPKPKYICCNADESEPGTFKDHVLMERNPHLLFEGCAIACYAIGAKIAYIYIRGEFMHVQHVLEAELKKAYDAGYLGKNIFGSGFDCDIYIHRGAGAYEAGEETALIESLEGKRAQPRIKPPFPAVAGLYQCPTAVNNVETLCNVPLIITHGADWFAKLGPEKNGGPKLYCISGQVKRPGVYEASMNTTLRDLVFGEPFAQGMAGGRTFKAIIPGGSSVPLLLDEHLDAPASFDGVQKAGSLLGSAGLIVLDDTVCMVWLAMNLLHFYRHESCGKCTPCREGGDWLYKLLMRVERGEGQMKDIDLLFGVANNIVGKTLCAFGDAAATPVLTTLKLFRHEFEAHVREGRCTLPAPWRAQGATLAHAH